jgi:RNA polymerase sigma-70 factor (ECF subfamily)
VAADPETLLFARFRDEGDVGALGQLYDLTAAELLRVAFHLVRDPARAEDLVQQTFVAAIEGAGRFDAERSVRSWLLGILANQARKLQRAEARVPPPGADAAIDPLDEVQTQEFTAAVDAAISTLPEVYQPVLVLHLKHGMIAAEIAHALRRPPGTVRTQLMRALELLKKALPPSIAVGACVLSTPLRGLAAVKQAVLADAATHVAAAAGAAGGAAGAVATASLVGGTVLMKKVIAAIACAAVLCLGAFVWLENNRAAANAAHTRDPAALVQASLASRAEPPCVAAAVCRRAA